MKIFFSYLTLLCSLSYFAQNTEHLSGFNMVSFSYKHDKNWSAYIELQERGIESFTKPDYYEMKGGIGYNFNKNNQLFLGGGKYGTYKNATISQEEFRLWIQYLYTQKVNSLRIDHRLRLEKRFFYYPGTDTSSNTERYRYRMALTLPINKEKIEPNTFFVNIFDEIFFGPELPNFKRNRVFGGVGYQFNDYFGTNLGYLWQREFSNSGNKNLHFLYLGLNFSFDRLKYRENHPIPVAD
jgi:hypothetical protein